MKIGIIGCTGRMGKALVEAVISHPQTTLSGGVVRAESQALGLDLGTIVGLEPVGINASSSIKHLAQESDAIIDFSAPKTTLECAALAAEHGTAHIIGTTGLTSEQFETLTAYAKKTPMIWSSNMSIGVNLLFALTKQVSAILDESYDIDILEMHHCHKVDAPSGTALSLGKAAAEGRKKDFEEVANLSREGITGPRPRGEIGFATLRGGDVVGDHHVIFAGDGERIELAHKSSNRKIYAKGALLASLWAAKQKAGFYSMQDVLT